MTIYAELTGTYCRRQDNICHHKPSLLNGHECQELVKKLQTFTGNGDFSIWVKILECDDKPQTNIYIWLASWERGPYFSTSQFLESDVKVCEFEMSKSNHLNPVIVLLAAFVLLFCTHTLFKLSSNMKNYPQRYILTIFSWKL